MAVIVAMAWSIVIVPIAGPVVTVPVVSAWAIAIVNLVAPGPVVGIFMVVSVKFLLSVKGAAITMRIPSNLLGLVLVILIFCEAASVATVARLDLRHDCK